MFSTKIQLALLLSVLTACAVAQNRAQMLRESLTEECSKQLEIRMQCLSNKTGEALDLPDRLFHSFYVTKACLEKGCGVPAKEYEATCETSSTLCDEVKRIKDKTDLKYILNQAQSSLDQLDEICDTKEKKEAFEACLTEKWDEEAFKKVKKFDADKAKKALCDFKDECKMDDDSCVEKIKECQCGPGLGLKFCDAKGDESEDESKVESEDKSEDESKVESEDKSEDESKDE